MKRYENNKIKIDKDGKRVYTSTYYPNVPLENSDEFIRTKVGTRLDNVAHTFYGDASLWWVIAKVNGISGKIVIPTATVLRIPSNVTKIISNFKKINS